MGGMRVNGIQYMIAGAAVLMVSTIGTALAEWLLGRKKKQIREQTYQIYD